MTTQEYIKKEAEKFVVNFINLQSRAAYEDGILKGTYLAKDFGDWLAECVKSCRVELSIDIHIYNVPNGSLAKTTSELFEIFLTERNEK